MLPNNIHTDIGDASESSTFHQHQTSLQRFLFNQKKATETDVSKAIWNLPWKTLNKFSVNGDYSSILSMTQDYNWLEKTRLSRHVLNGEEPYKVPTS